MHSICIYFCLSGLLFLSQPIEPLLTIYFEDNDANCGTLGEPPGAHVFITNPIANWTLAQLYNETDEQHSQEGSQVWYRCVDPDDQLVGNDTRVCSRGKWLGTVPRCAINYLNQTGLSLIEVLDTKLKSVTSSVHIESSDYNIYGAYSTPERRRPEECIKWRISEEQLWIFNVNRIVDAHHIRLVLTADGLRQAWLRKLIKFRVQLNNLWGLKCQQTYGQTDDHSSSAADGQLDNYLTVEFACESKHNLSKTQSQSGNKMQNIFVNFSVKSTLKKFTIGLCDLRVYHFRSECGSPDYPIGTLVRESSLYHNEYVYLCPDNDHIIDGNTRIRCGRYGQWLDEFPKCAPKRYCAPIGFEFADDSVEISYESFEFDLNGDKVIPDGKIANFSCRRRPDDETGLELTGKSDFICRNGHWRGLSLEERPRCVSTDTLSSFQTSMSNKITIRVLSGVLLVCLVVIACLVVYMYVSKRLKRRHKLRDMQANMQLNNEYKVSDCDQSADKNYEPRSTPHIYEYIANDYENIVLPEISVYYNNLNVVKDVNIDKNNSIYSNYK